MKVAVFGGTGFVGSYIIDELIDNNHEPVVQVREGSESKLANSEKCKIVQGSLDDIKLIEKYEDLWKWEGLSLNKYLPWSIELIEKFEVNDISNEIRDKVISLAKRAYQEEKSK